MTGAIEANSSTAHDPDKYLGHDLIFVISQPRSGSTLLQRLLSGHSWIQTSAETWLMLHPAYGLRRKGIKTDYRAGWAVRAVEEFLVHYADGRETWLNAVRAYARTVYGEVLARNDRRRFLDKTPRYSMIVPELREIFPEARFIVLLRNPLAVLSSELRTYIKGDWPLLADFAPDLLEAPARLLAAREVLGDRMCELHYENLVKEPAEELQRLCHHLGLPWESGLEDYSETPAPRGRFNDPVGVHRHQRPSLDSLETWRELGRSAQTRSVALAYLDAIGNETVREMGYDPAALRAGIEAETVSSGSRRVFPWRTAIRPYASWSLRDFAAASWYFAAEEHGPFFGFFVAARMLLWHGVGGLARQLGRPIKGPGRPRAKSDRDGD